MPKYVNIQVRGVDKAVRIEADKVERSNIAGTVAGSSSYALTIKLKDTQVGEFNGNDVAGWWFEDERR